MPHCLVFRLMLLLLVAPTVAGAGVPVAPAPAGVSSRAPLRAPPRPIASRAQLDDYLRDTPAALSPLNWLTPGAQRRFLASLIFHQHGLGGMDLGELRYELTREQAHALLRLFGAQDSALDLDALSMPRTADADGAASTLEPAFDRLVTADSQGEPGPTQSQAVAGIYATEFSGTQTDAQRHLLGNHDMEFLFRAAALTFRATRQPGYLADMRRDFAELARRHRIDRPHLADLHDALVVAHHAAEADALLAVYPPLAHQPMPVMRSSTRVRRDQPSLWIVTLDTRKREVVRYPFNTRIPSQIIVLASTQCHYSRDAARDIEADPLLRGLFRQYAQWVAPASELTAFDAVRRWNVEHPTLRLGIAYDNAELRMVDRLDTPVFYFLDHGKLVDKVVGWPTGGNLEAIRRGLKQINVLP